MLLPIHKNTKLLIFDCDGTIANNMQIHTQAWTKVLKDSNIDISTVDLDKYNGLPSRYILEEIFKFKDYEIPLISDQIKQASHKLLDQTKPIEPIVNLIKHYYGKIPMFVISGGSKKNVIKSLDVLEITSMFDEIITADDDHPAKNTTEAFTLLSDKYNLSPKECHVFEDGVPGLINALQAGMTVTDVRNIDLN